MGLIPDIRVDCDYLPLRSLVPRFVRKDYIQNPEQASKPRDFLINYYFSKPDYEAPQEKLFYMGVLGAKIGTFYGIFEIMSKDISVWREAMVLFAKRCGFFTASFLTYGAVTNAVANIRKKDDCINHAVGGASVGFLVGYTAKCSAKGSLAGVGCAMLAVAFKRFSQQNEFYIFHPNSDLLVERNSMIGGTKYQDWRVGHYKEERVRRQHYLFPD